MKIQISTNLIRHYLKNVYFINGHSYAGKSTMVSLLAERFDMIACGENYHFAFPKEEMSRWEQPAICYFDTMSGWEEWLNLSPEAHYNWMEQTSQECTEIEILELLRLASSGKKIIADTNIPPYILHEISDYDHVAIMLCDPPDISAQKYFEREDAEKKFIMEKIRQCKDPEATLKNFNSWISYQPPHGIDWANCGFYTHTRSDFEHDTKEETFNALAAHFKLL